MEPKAQCKVCLSYWDVDIVYCTCGHFLRNGTEENKKFVQYTMDLLSIPNYYIKKGRPLGHRYGKKPGDHEYYIANSLQKKTRRSSSWVSTTGSSATRSSARMCLTSVAMNKYVVRWTNWRTKTIRTTSLQKKFVCSETIGGFVRTQLVPIRCQFGIDLISSKHSQPSDSSKTKRTQLISKDGKVIPHLGGTGKNPTKTGTDRHLFLLPTILFLFQVFLAKSSNTRLCCFLPHYNSKQSCTRNRWQSDSHVAVVEQRRILLSLTPYERTASPKKHRKNNLDDYSLGFLILCTLSPRHSTTCFLSLSLY